jgi:hypothetical protein
MSKTENVNVNELEEQKIVIGRLCYGYENNCCIDIIDPQIVRLVRLLLSWDWDSDFLNEYEVYVFLDHRGYRLVVRERDDKNKIGVTVYRGFYTSSMFSDIRNRVGNYLKILLAPYEKALDVLIDRFLEASVEEEEEVSEENF